jgi:hypothetical protein
MNDEHDDVGRLGPRLNDELKQFATELSRLRPREDRLDREKLAFLAGQASVTSSSTRRPKLLGLPLESRAGPAAFASMSAIAAGLLVALLMRPEVSSIQRTAASDRDLRVEQRVAGQSSPGREILTTRDVHLDDIQSRLTKRDVGQSDGDISLPSPREREMPILTPSAWHQVINKSKAANPSADDSSSLFQIRGATL